MKIRHFMMIFAEFYLSMRLDLYLSAMDVQKIFVLAAYYRLKNIGIPMEIMFARTLFVMIGKYRNTNNI